MYKMYELLHRLRANQRRSKALDTLHKASNLVYSYTLEQYSVARQVDARHNEAYLDYYAEQDERTASNECDICGLVGWILRLHLKNQGTYDDLSHEAYETEWN